MSNPWVPQTVDLLVIEDDPNDLALLKAAIDRNGVRASVRSAGSGAAALQELETSTPPDLILLDLRLPDMDGIEVLETLKRDPSLVRIPVIILSGSTNPADVDAGYALHAAAYLPKPHTVDGWQHLVRVFRDHWLKMVLLPKL